MCLAFLVPQRMRLADLPKRGKIIDVMFLLKQCPVASPRMRVMSEASACFFGSCRPFLMDRATAGTRQGMVVHHA